MEDGNGLSSADTVADLGFEHDADRQIESVAFALTTCA
jgi:hypothetical protein